MFIYRSNSGLLWHMYTAKINFQQVPKIDEMYSTSWLLDLSLQKKINDLLNEGNIEKMDSKHNIPQTEYRPSRFSFTTYYIDTMIDFLKLKGEDNLYRTKLWEEVTNDKKQFDILKIFRFNDFDDDADTDKDLLFIKKNIFGKYKCPSFLKHNDQEVEDTKFTKEIYNTYNKEISKILNDYFIIDDKSEKICHFTAVSNKIEFQNYDHEKIKKNQLPLPWELHMDKYIGIFEATIEYIVNSIKIKSKKTQKDFHLVYMNYNFNHLKNIGRGDRYNLNEEIFKKDKNYYNAPLFLTDDLSSLNSRYPVYNKIIPMGIYTCKIFEYINQVKGNLNRKYRGLSPYLFLGNYMNNMWPFNKHGKQINESECDKVETLTTGIEEVEKSLSDKKLSADKVTTGVVEVMNIPPKYTNKIEEFKKEIEKLKETNVKMQEDCNKTIFSKNT